VPIRQGVLNLELAWRRTVVDLAERRTFVRHPFLDTLVESELPAWLAKLSRLLAAGEFRPDACRIVPVPKPHGHIRPGADLSLSDQVVYAALVEHMRPQIADALGPRSGNPDYSYQLRADGAHAHWFEPFFGPWRAFDRDSAAALNNGVQFVVVADVAGCYEDVDLYTLRSDLNGLGVDAAVLTELMECLHRWSRVQKRGVPQGHSPSDLLAKLYMRAVDLTLIAEGFNHRRWVDDFRIFCTTEAEARRAIVVLADALGRRGLILQTAKSKILTADQARERFTEVPTLLDPIQLEVAQQIARDEGYNASYLPPWILDELLAGAGAEAATEILRSAFHNYFVVPGQVFNKSLFHYLLSRLGAARDATYAEQTIALFRVHPEEFDDIADYCSTVGVEARLEETFLELQASGLLPYPYVTYQFLRWRVRQDGALSLTLRPRVRAFAFEVGQPWYVRAVARAVLGKHGDRADLESLEASYVNAQSPVERAEIVCALQRMEAGRRNALYGRAAGDGELPSQAVRLARGARINWAAC
jgi:hypothetical protein